MSDKPGGTPHRSVWPKRTEGRGRQQGVGLVREVGRIAESARCDGTAFVVLQHRIESRSIANLAGAPGPGGESVGIDLDQTGRIRPSAVEGPDVNPSVCRGYSVEKTHAGKRGLADLVGTDELEWGLGAAETGVATARIGDPHAASVVASALTRGEEPSVESGGERSAIQVVGAGTGLIHPPP